MQLPVDIHVANNSPGKSLKPRTGNSSLQIPNHELGIGEDAELDGNLKGINKSNLNSFAGPKVLPGLGINSYEVESLIAANNYRNCSQDELEEILMTNKFEIKRLLREYFTLRQHEAKKDFKKKLNEIVTKKK